MFLSVGSVRSRSPRSAWLAGLALGLVHCGSRSGLDTPEVEVAPPPVLSCDEDSDCEQQSLCVTYACRDGFCEPSEEIVCESDDVCLEGACNEQTGDCEFFPRAKDDDGDGFLGPLGGQVAGAVGACGDDCNDGDSQTYPGSREICDGRDNDCDGVIDNDLPYLADVTAEPDILRVAEADATASESSSLVSAEGRFVVGYWAEREGANKPYLRSMPPGGADPIGETRVTTVNTGSFGPVLAPGVGMIGSAFSDNRFGDDYGYEVFFAPFSLSGEKLGPDVRLTESFGMSVNEQIVFVQDRFVVVFQDFQTQGTGAAIFGQIVDVGGTPIGGNVKLTEEGLSADVPAVATASDHLGVAYVQELEGRPAVGFRTFDLDLVPTSSSLLLSPGARYPSVTPLGEDFLVAWELIDEQSFPGSAIWGAVVSKEGRTIVPARPITEQTSHARTHSVAVLGDRFLLSWADDRTGNYELFARVLARDFAVLEATTRLTNDPSVTMAGFSAVGEGGTIGIVFEDFRDQRKQSYFLTVGCGEVQACNCQTCVGDECVLCCVR